MNKTFEEFYKEFGFVEYPFSVYTAENEESEKLFMKPNEYSLLESAFHKGNSMIINGDRGTGKTIILKELYRNVQQDNIICFIDNYEIVKLKNNKYDFYNLFLKYLVDGIIVYLIDHKKKLNKLSKENKTLLSFLIFKYGDNVSEGQITKKIENIQLNLIQRLINTLSPLFTQVANYGATAITNFGYESLTRYFGKYLPDLDEGTVKSIFPDIKFKIDNGFIELETSYELMVKVLTLANELNLNKIILFIDKLDEDTRLENDAEEISNFIEPLFAGNQLLLNTDIQLIIAVWKIPFDMLKSKFRRQKHFVYDIEWTYDELKSVLNHRIQVYSKSKIRRFSDIFEENIKADNINNIFRLSNSNPRDLWHIFHQIFRAQYNIDSNKKRLSNKAIINGLNKFVKDFDFYEYYPKKKNARKNTNDIYSYIQHLLKLDNSDFTHGELEAMANTGGSTTNYITGMMNIGVVEKTPNKREGSVLYSIKDPKIIYAIENDIDIG